MNETDQVREIFLAALKIPSQQRSDYLRETCADDDNLRQRIERLLQAHLELGSIAEPKAGAPDATCEQPAITEHPGTGVGHYKLLQQIGEGGMGVVWMAEQTQPVQRKVALKVIKPGMDSRQVIARFEAERQALALMDHVNIARVFDGGTTENGRPYFVMELVHGVPITKYCDDNHLTPRERLELFVPVCQAIQHAHQKGIIHRDIKPSNVMVTLYDGKPVPKVIDFGVAKATEQRLTERTLFTQYGTMVGTLEYMSPEQAEMSALGVDTRSDIYSLGVLLYELLTGTTPLTQKRLKEAAYGEILRMIREEEAPKPSTRLSDSGEALASISANRHMEPAKLTKMMRGELDWIAMKTLEKDRNRRYETAKDFAADVQRYLNDEPVLACPPSRWYRFRKSARRNKGALLTAFVGVMALLLAVVGLVVSNTLISWEMGEKEVALIEKGKALIAAKASEDAALIQEGRATDNATKAETQRGVAVKNEKIAKDNELLAKRRYYAAQMNLAVRAWEEADTPRVLDLLETQRPRHAELDLRAFEWYALWQLCHQQLRFSQQARPGYTYVVAFSPDASLIALGSTDGTAKLMDAASGREIRTLQGGGRSRSGAVAFSPDGKLLAHVTGLTEDEVSLWTVSTGDQARVLSGAGKVSALTFAPDGMTLATGTQEGTVCLWETATGILKHTWKTHPVLAIGFSPDSKLLVTSNNWATGKGSLFWDVSVTPSKLVHETPIRGNTVGFSADGKRFAVGSPSAFELFDTDTWKKTPGRRGPWGHGRSLAFIPGRDAIAVGVDSRSVKIVDLKTGQAETFAHHAPVHSLAVASDGKAVAAVGTDAVLKVWNLGPGAQPDTVKVGGSAIYSLGISPDGKTLAAGISKMVKLFDVDTAAPLRDLTGHSESVQVLAFFRDGKTLSTGSAVWAEPGELKLWDFRTGKAPARSLEFNASALALAIAPDDQTLAVGGPHVDLALFDVPTGNRLTVLKAPQLTALTYSPDGKILISAIGGGKITLRDPRTGAERLTFGSKESAIVWNLSCSPDGKFLATGNQLGHVYLWELPSGRLRASLRGNTAAVHSVAFFPDGKTLATSNEDGEVKLWDVTTGQERITFRFGSRLAISPDGTMLAAGKHGSVRLLRASSAPEALARKSELNPDDPEGPLAELDGGDRLWATGDKDAAEKAYRRAHERLLVLKDLFPQEVAYRRELVRSALSLRLLLADRGAAEAEQVWKQAQANYQTLPPDELLALARNSCAIGDMLRTAGAQDAAFRAFAQAIELKPDDLSVWFRRGYAYGQFGQHEKAIADYQKVVALDPKNAGAWNNLGVAHDRLKQPDKAVEYYSKAVEVGPTNVLAWHNRGIRYRELGETDKAHADFSRAVELQPTNTVYRRERALLSEKLKRTDEAIADYSKIIELEPKLAPAWASRGLVYYNLGQWEKAVADYSKALELKPDVLLHWHYRGNAYVRLRQYDKAVVDYSKVIELKPNDVAGWSNRGAAYSNLGQWDKAVADYSKALELKPDVFRYRNNRGDAFLRLRQYEKAIADYSKVIELKPDDAAARTNRASAYFNLQQWDQAIADYSKALDLKPDDANAWFQRARAHGNLRQWDKAIADYSKVIDLNPDQASAWHSRAIAYVNGGQRSKAAADFVKVVELNPRDAVAWNHRGIVHEKLGQPEKAASDFTKATELAGADAKVWFQLGQSHDAWRRWQEGIRCYAKAVELKPDYAEAWIERGASFVLLKEWDKAIADYSKVIELKPDEVGGWNNRGLAYFNMGQHDKAVADYSKAIALKPGNSMAWFGRAVILARVGQWDKARADYSKALELAPKNAVVHNNLAWLLATCPDAKFRDPARALTLAKKAVELAPKEGGHWNTLGVAHYRAAGCKAAVVALEKSMELRKSGDANDWFFLAMAHWQLDQKPEARKWYDRGVAWMEKNQEVLKKGQHAVEELSRFHAEAAELLQIKKK